MVHKCTACHNNNNKNKLQHMIRQFHQRNMIQPESYDLRICEYWTDLMTAPHNWSPASKFSPIMASTVYSHMSSMSFFPSFFGMLYVHFPPLMFAGCSHMGSIPDLKRW